MRLFCWMPDRNSPAEKSIDDWHCECANLNRRQIEDGVTTLKQTYEVKGGPQIGRDNLPLLRKQLSAQGLDGFYIPHEDEWQNEYLPPSEERLAWATGFTGSAGSALVLPSTAQVFVDGRYTIQAHQQIDIDLFDILDLIEPGPQGWLKSQQLQNLVIGYDPRHVSPDQLSSLQSSAELAGAQLKSVTRNPIDEAWQNRPEEPTMPVTIHEQEFAGEAHTNKIMRIANELRSLNADTLVITSPSSIAWLFNVHGGDVQCSPLPLGRALLHRDATADLFLHPSKTSEQLADHLGETVQMRPINELDRRLTKLEGKTVWLDPAATPVWFFEKLEKSGAKILRKSDPIALPRACKNDVEIAGSQSAHVRDGVALTRFLFWLAGEEVQSGQIDEIEASKKLEMLRDADGQLKDISFETISAAGPNGAITHYRVNEATNRNLEPGSLYLVDSGGQYDEGTTDVTRTVAIGTPSSEHKQRYTLVLKGHIAMSTIRFPKGTTGSALDAIARAPLWMQGLDYDHGTGHGVGSYLGVHEGPQRISKTPNTIALQPGMIVSNEPGYYKQDDYGIRIENLQFVTQAKSPRDAEREMLGFETLTLAPLDRKLIEEGMLTSDEWRWVDAYHARVMKEISPRLYGHERDWLEAACAPLGVDKS